MHRKWWTLIVVSVATFMLLLDITVVNTALPAIEEDLGASFTELQWVIDAYTLSLAALVLTAGVLADRLGRRRVFAAGLVIFTVASLLAGFAPDPTFLNLSRGLQGVGGAIMFAVSLAMIVGLLAGAGALMALFIAIETRVKQPMLPLHLFRKPAFTGVQLAALAVSASMFALFLYLTFYLQGYLGHDPLEAGLRYLPYTIVTFLVSAATGALISKVPARVLLSAGLGITGIGLLLMGGLDPADEWTALLGGFLLGGAGVGLINPVIADVALSVVPKEQSGMAAGINDTFRQVGIAVGIAAWGAIFLGRGAAKVEEVAAGTPAATGERPRQLVEAGSAGNLDQALAAVPPGARDQVANAANEGFLAGLNDIVMLGGIISIAGALAALWLVRERDIQRGA